MPFGLFGGKKDEKKPWENPNHPIYRNKMSMPYLAKLQGHMEVGQTVCLKGYVRDMDKDQIKEKDPKIDVIFSSGGGQDPKQAALWISISFKDKKVTLNSRDKGEWGKEEKKSLAPFSINGKFDLRVRAHSDKFEIDVNGKDYAIFDHRIPLTSVDNLSVLGDALTLCDLSWGGRTYSVPFRTALIEKNKVHFDHAIYLMLVPEKKKTGFTVNLKNSKNGDVLLHFNPRFKEKLIVRNSKKNGQWEKEEREGGMPFENNIDADLVLVNEKYGWQIYVNDEFFCSWAHRGDPMEIDECEIEGDVELLSFQVRKDKMHD